MAHAAHVHDHSLPHLHDHAHPSHQGRRLRWALVLTALFFVAEVVGGVVSNSLALLADAGHMFTDVGALALSLFVAWFSRQPAAPEKTYGYLRFEILAALLNGAVLLLVSGLIVWEAIGRLQSPEPLQGSVMLFVALGGLAVNAASAAILHPVHGHSLNARGAYLHVLGDLLGSVGTVAAAIIIRWTGWLAADPIASIVVTLMVVRSAWRLVREAVNVLLEASPAHISLGRVREGAAGHHRHRIRSRPARVDGDVGNGGDERARRRQGTWRKPEGARGGSRSHAATGDLARDTSGRTRFDLRDALPLERLNSEQRATCNQGRTGPGKLPGPHDFSSLPPLVAGRWSLTWGRLW